MSARFFAIEGRSIIPGLWGDYGDILQHGMTAHRPRVDGKLALERTGPYIPPITLPGIGDLVVTSEARTELEASGLSEFSFVGVEKLLIVELSWEQWDLNAEDPAEFPRSGEPEDYILGKAHSPKASEALGELWEVVVPRTATVLRTRGRASGQVLKIDLSTWNGADLFRSNDYGSVLFSERARDWFSERWGNYVTFVDFPAE